MDDQVCQRIFLPRTPSKVSFFRSPAEKNECSETREGRNPTRTKPRSEATREGRLSPMRECSDCRTTRKKVDTRPIMRCHPAIGIEGRMIRQRRKTGTLWCMSTLCAGVWSYPKWPRMPDENEYIPLRCTSGTKAPRFYSTESLNYLQ